LFFINFLYTSINSKQTTKWGHWGSEIDLKITKEMPVNLCFYLLYSVYVPNPEEGHEGGNLSDVGSDSAHHLVKQCTDKKTV
jgi:hypothetical protein